MRHAFPTTPQFYVTAPQPCPYLDDRMERKLFISLDGETAQPLNDKLSKQGFRRSQNVLYRPACAECMACLSARIRVADFRPDRTQRKLLRRNADLRRNGANTWATENQFRLFKRYLAHRHAGGGMADMDIFEFAAMVEETRVRSYLIEYIRADERDGDEKELAAVSLTDMLDDGLSMVYSFFDPDLERRSLGTYLILDHVAIAKELGLSFVYLGYWVPGSAKMAYKQNFSALEIYRQGQWVPIGSPDDHLDMLTPAFVDPIAHQITNLVLPTAGTQGE